jgi:hypothetical protein
MKLHSHLTYANVVATVCLFIVLGGTSYAVATGSIDSREIKNNTVRSKDIRNDDVRSKDVRNQSLLAKDFAPGQLPVGPRGATGPQGATGPRGATGPPGPAAGSESFHVVGTAGEPQFQVCYSGNSRLWSTFTTAPAFFRDWFGVVHLRGNVRCPSVNAADTPTFFQLPAGYRPGTLENHVVVEANAVDTNVVTVTPATGAVGLADLAGNPPKEEFVTLDGITFRCGPSGENGCP